MSLRELHCSFSTLLWNVTFPRAGDKSEIFKVLFTLMAQAPELVFAIVKTKPYVLSGLQFKKTSSLPCRVRQKVSPAARVFRNAEMLCGLSPRTTCEWARESVTLHE